MKSQIFIETIICHRYAMVVFDNEYIEISFIINHGISHFHTLSSMDQIYMTLYSIQRCEG